MRRKDNGPWGPPGGMMEPGEDFALGDLPSDISPPVRSFYKGSRLSLTLKILVKITRN